MPWLDWRIAFRTRPKLTHQDGPKLEDIANIETLAEAWGRVRANKGGHGGDGVTITEFSQNIDRFLRGLSRELLSERYTPRDVRHITIAKQNDRARALAIPAVIDRVAQTAAMLALDPHIDRRMSETSFGYRNGRSVQNAIKAIEQSYLSGYVWTVDADIKQYFNTIWHRQLMADLAIWIDDERILRLLALWIAAFGRRGRGIGQGAPISPLFSNVFLHPVDRLMAARGHQMVRYADDFVVLSSSASDAQRALREVDKLLRGRGLELNPIKTKILPPGTGFVFLGCRLCAEPTRSAGLR